MNELEIKILNEIIDNMDKILVEKQDKHNNTWKTCDLTYLKHNIAQRANKLFFHPNTLNQDNELRELIHIFNYAFFLYYRLIQESIKPFKLTGVND